MNFSEELLNKYRPAGSAEELEKLVREHLSEDELSAVAGGEGDKQLVETFLRCITPGCGHTEVQTGEEPITVCECPKCLQMSLIGINVRYYTAE